MIKWQSQLQIYLNTNREGHGSQACFHGKLNGCFIMFARALNSGRKVHSLTNIENICFYSPAVALLLRIRCNVEICPTYSQGIGCPQEPSRSFSMNCYTALNFLVVSSTRNKGLPGKSLVVDVNVRIKTCNMYPRHCQFRPQQVYNRLLCGYNQIVKRTKDGIKPTHVFPEVIKICDLFFLLLFGQNLETENIPFTK